MAEYIDKDKLIDRFDELCNTICQYSKKQRAVMCSSCELGIAFDVVDDFPSADVQPVKHGRWVRDAVYVDETTGEPCIAWFCNQCGEPQMVGTNYCPNCGARMDSEK